MRECEGTGGEGVSEGDSGSKVDGVVLLPQPTVTGQEACERRDTIHCE